MRMRSGWRVVFLALASTWGACRTPDGGEDAWPGDHGRGMPDRRTTVAEVRSAIFLQLDSNLRTPDGVMLVGTHSADRVVMARNPNNFAVTCTAVLTLPNKSPLTDLPYHFVPPAYPQPAGCGVAYTIGLNTSTAKITLPPDGCCALTIEYYSPGHGPPEAGLTGGWIQLVGAGGWIYAEAEIAVQ